MNVEYKTKTLKHITVQMSYEYRRHSWNLNGAIRRLSLFPWARNFTLID